MIQGEKFKGFGKICYPQIGGVSSPSRPNPEFINSNEDKFFSETEGTEYVDEDFAFEFFPVQREPRH